MAEILGLTVSDFPFLRMKPVNMPWVFHGNLAWGWRDRPHLFDQTNWAEQLRKEWLSDQDQGRTAGAAHQQRQIEQFSRLRQGLDDFKPDLIINLYRDIGETFDGDERPQFWINTHDSVALKPFQVFSFFRDNYFEEDPDRIVNLKGHPQAGEHLAAHLERVGISPRVVPKPIHLEGIGHNAVATAVHLNWQKREFDIPVVQLGIDPFRFGRVRGEQGLSPWDTDRDDPPLSPRQAFDLGVEIARAYRDSPWRIALVAGVDWSHANDSAEELERMHPDVTADQARFEQWRKGDFGDWGDNWSFTEMEEHAQWELLITIVLAGAMSEIGARVEYADFQPTWVCNDNFVTTLFSPA